MSGPKKAESVAVAACLSGGRYLERAYASGDTDATLVVDVVVDATSS